MTSANVQNEATQSNTQRIIKKNIYVLGGHKLSCDYLSRIKQAFDVGLLAYEDLFFIDDHEKPPAADQNFSWIKKSYVEGLAELLGKTVHPTDVLIPDHTAPHVLMQLLLYLIAHDKNLAGTRVEILPFKLDLKLPFQRANAAQMVALSFAGWVCPLDCTEPGVCPAIEDKRTWNFNESLNSYLIKHHEVLKSENHLFFCDQLVYGVGQVSLLEVKLAWDKLRSSLMNMATSGHRFLVATFSKCHGILGLVEARPQAHKRSSL